MTTDCHITYSTRFDSLQFRLALCIYTVLYEWFHWYSVWVSDCPVERIIDYETVQDKSAELCFIFHNVHCVLYFSWKI